MTEAHAQVAIGIATAGDAEIAMRQYFSSWHLWSARHFGWLAQQIEDSVDWPKLRVQHRSYVISGVIASAAFVEAAINEVFQDVLDGHDWHGKLDSKTSTALSLLWEMTGEGKSGFTAIEKYDLALGLADRPRFDKSRAPYQDVKLIFEIRNWLMHYRPKNLTQSRPDKLARGLAGKFKLNIMYPGVNPDFPDRMLSAGCVAWANASAFAFVNQFSSELSLNLHHTQVNFGDPHIHPWQS